MKSNAFTRYKYSADLYKFSVENVGSKTETKYYFSKKILIKASLDLSGRLAIRCDEPIDIGCLVSNITDSNNILVLDDQIWQINSIEPVLSPFSTIDDYRHKANKFQGTL